MGLIETPTKQQLYALLPQISQIMKEKRARTFEHCWRSKDELIDNVLQWTPTHRNTSVSRPAKRYISQFCADTGGCLEDLSRVIIDRDRWWEIDSRESAQSARPDDGDNVIMYKINALLIYYWSIFKRGIETTVSD